MESRSQANKEGGIASREKVGESLTRLLWSANMPNNIGAKMRQTKAFRTTSNIVKRIVIKVVSVYTRANVYMYTYGYRLCMYTYA